MGESLRHAERHSDDGCVRCRGSDRDHALGNLGHGSGAELRERAPTACDVCERSDRKRRRWHRARGRLRVCSAVRREGRGEGCGASSNCGAGFQCGDAFDDYGVAFRDWSSAFDERGGAIDNGSGARHGSGRGPILRNRADAAGRVRAAHDGNGTGCYSGTRHNPGDSDASRS